MKLIYTLVLIILFFSTFAFSDTIEKECTPHDKKAYTYALIPWVSPNIAHYFSQKIGDNFKDNCIDILFNSASNYSQYLDKALKNSFDLLDVPPHIASYLVRYYKYKFVISEAVPAQTYLVTSAVSSIDSISDVDNKEVGFPDPLAMVTYIAKADFFNDVDVEIKYYSSHDKILKDILANKIDAGVIYSFLYNQMSEDLKANYRIVKKHHLSISGNVIAHPTLSEKEILSLQKILIQSKKRKTFYWKRLHVMTEAEEAILHKEQAPYVKMLGNHLNNN